MRSDRDLRLASRSRGRQAQRFALRRCRNPFVWCNGIEEAQAAGVHCGNVMVCYGCDGPDIYQRLAEHERIGKERYWSLRDPEDLPRNPHSPPWQRARHV